tara:strand:+ start:261 stop:479 length:219 start_codon:yes stop_codon:yes gene_type:complete
MEEKQLQEWLDSMAGMILWSKENGVSPEETLGTLSHDVHGINATVYQGMKLFMPRSYGYLKYCPNETNKASE